MGQSIIKSINLKNVLVGIRSIGYSFSTAVADIIDNSISAFANKIFVYSDPSYPEPFVAFIDNGCGMSLEELENAMLLGSDRTIAVNNEKQLGKYGLGLKSASLSQCTKFTVISKKNSSINGLSFDLEKIEHDYCLLLLSEDEINSISLVSNLREFESGTIVIWNNFDRLNELTSEFDKSFRKSINDAKKHCELVFHRFYDEIDIYFNERKIKRRDPFLQGSYGRTQKERPTKRTINGKTIVITPYILPYENSLTEEELELLGNPKSIYDDQGLYIYRNKRLIAYGGWFRLNSRSEFNKQARVQVDIPADLDDLWDIDVKKSSVQVPDKLKEDISIAITKAVAASGKIIRGRGYSQKSDNPIWYRYVDKEGVVKYRIKEDNSDIQKLFEILGENKKTLKKTIKEIENNLPIYSIYTDYGDTEQKYDTSLSDEDVQALVDLISYLISCPKEERVKKLELALSLDRYKKLLSKKELLKEALTNEQL